MINARKTIFPDFLVPRAPCPSPRIFRSPRTVVPDRLCFTRDVFTAQCTLVHMRGLGIACRLSVSLFVCLSVCDVGDL